MEQLQDILEKINREGIEKAEAEYARITGEAKAKADALMKSAREDAAAAKADAERAAADYASRANETIRQAARDIVLDIEGRVSKLLTKLLLDNVNQALAADAVTIVKNAIANLTGPGEIAACPQLAAALKAQLAANTPFTVVTDDTLGTGFTVKTDGGRVEHSFTGDTIAEELARRLRTDLAELVR